MDRPLESKSIPKAVASELCSEISRESHLNWDSVASRWCWSCQKLAKGNRSRYIYAKQPGNRGCPLINARYAEQIAPTDVPITND